MHTERTLQHERYVWSIRGQSDRSTVLCTLAPPHTPKDFDFVSSSMPSPYTIRTADNQPSTSSTLQQRFISHCRASDASHTILRHARHFKSVQRNVTQSHPRQSVYCCTSTVQAHCAVRPQLLFHTWNAKATAPASKTKLTSQQLHMSRVCFVLGALAPSSQQSRHRNNLCE